MIKTYKYNDKSQIAPHFHVYEFKCKCGKMHNTKIDINLVELLEKLRSKLNAKACNVYSGFRCPAHNRAVGGGTNGSHTYGYAADVWFKGQNGKPIPSDKVAILLEDLGHKYGIGWRCGRSSISTGRIHIDTRPRKWYGDEYYSNSKSISSLKAYSDGKIGHTSYLTYIYKPVEKTVTASYLNCRSGKGTNFSKVGGYPRNTKLKVYYIEDGWAKVDINKWVSAQYLK